MRNFVFIMLAMACGLFTALLALALWMMTTETLSVRDTPLPATMAEGIQLQKSGKSAWVQLTDATADCQRYAQFTSNWGENTPRQSAAFIATNAEKNIEIAAVVQDIKQCDYLGRVHFIGMLKVLDADERKKFAADGLPLSETTDPKYWLCTWCVPEERNWVLLIIMLGLVTGAGFGTRALWRARRSSPKTVTTPKTVGNTSAPSKTAQRQSRNKKPRP